MEFDPFERFVCPDGLYMISLKTTVLSSTNRGSSGSQAAKRRVLGRFLFKADRRLFINLPFVCPSSVAKQEGKLRKQQPSVFSVTQSENTNSLADRKANAVKDFGLRRMDWPSRDSTVRFQSIFQRLGNPSLRRDGLPIRGKFTGRHNVGCGWANPSYIYQ